MKRILLIAAAVFTTSAFATTIGNPPGGGGIQAQTQGQNQGQAQIQGQAQGQGQAQFTNVEVSNRISNDVRSNAAAFAGGGDAKSGSYSAGGDAKSGSFSKSNSGGNTLSNGGNTQNVTVTDSGKMEYSGKYEVKNVPSVFSGNVYPTAPCMGSSTVGGAGVGFGFSVGTSWKDVDCSIRETSRSFAGMGLKEDALHVLCSSEHAAAAPSCKALAAPIAKQE